ncbi:LytR family transcriptional regulator [Lentzea guizhouensis]|uniref:LytR family transcriptional regulator n=1 Tax=Lentzea guizhouensis TaxID=1586287 RepID=A0A1B2HJF1_9PSEU|nr:LCP family protein [Lentzea guizhouensis]ANZ37856.1 LytR family transcriptional regulator [Lentzea guizhouensis]
MTAASRAKKAVLVTGRTVVALLAVAALVFSGYFWTALRLVKQNTNTTQILEVLEDIPNSPPVEDGAVDILLVGSDSRTDAQGRPLPADVLRKLRTESTDTVNTDTIIVMRVPRNGGKASAISIPRDTYVPIPGFREDKINAAYGAVKYLTAERLQAEGVSDQAERERRSDEAGRKALVQSVQELTGMRVDHYAEINLYGFYLLTEVIGGVRVCLKAGTSDPNSGANFRAGEQVVSGGDALSFVRQRNMPGGDLGRIARQQVFMSQAMKQLLSAGTFTDPAKMNGLLDAISKSVVVDQKLDLATLATQAQGLASGNVEFATIPVTNIDARNERGQSVVTVDREAVKAWVRQLIGETVPPAPPSTAGSTSVAPSGTPTPSTPARFGGERLLSLDGNRAVAALQPSVPCVD